MPAGSGSPSRPAGRCGAAAGRRGRRRRRSRSCRQQLVTERCRRLGQAAGHAVVRPPSSRRPGRRRARRRPSSRSRQRAPSPTRTASRSCRWRRATSATCRPGQRLALLQAEALGGGEHRPADAGARATCLQLRQLVAVEFADVRQRGRCRQQRRGALQLQQGQGGDADRADVVGAARVAQAARDAARRDRCAELLRRPEGSWKYVEPAEVSRPARAERSPGAAVTAVVVGVVPAGAGGSGFVVGASEVGAGCAGSGVAAVAGLAGRTGIADRRVALAGGVDRRRAVVRRRGVVRVGGRVVVRGRVVRRGGVVGREPSRRSAPGRTRARPRSTRPLLGRLRLLRRRGRRMRAGRPRAPRPASTPRRRRRAPQPSSPLSLSLSTQSVVTDSEQ